jgi:hypothetical protein
MAKANGENQECANKCGLHQAASNEGSGIAKLRFGRKLVLSRPAQNKKCKVCGMRNLVLCSMAVIAFAGCATPKFQGVSPHPIVKGTGGAPTTVDGIQFWQGGTPKRKYEILGYVDDYWRGPALDEFDFRHLAPLVTKNGGDAAVVIRGDGPAPGLVRQSDETGDDVMRLQVIKFL